MLINFEQYKKNYTPAVDQKKAIEYRQIALDAFEEGIYHQAKTYFQKLLDIIKNEADQLPAAELYHYLGMIEWYGYEVDEDESALEDAISLFTRGLQIIPDHPVLLNNRGELYGELGHYPQAFNDYNRLILLFPDEWFGYYNRGMLHYDHGDFEKSIKDLTRTLELKPDHIDGRYIRGYLQMKQKRLSEALSDFKILLQYDGENRREYLQICGNLHYQLKEFETAITLFTEALKETPEDGSLYRNLGMAYDELHNSETALSYYNLALKYNPSDLISLNNRGLTLFKLKQFEASIHDYNTILSIDPGSLLAYHNRSDIYLDLGKCDEALRDASEALKINPDFADAHTNRGNARCQAGDYETGINDHSRAIELDPNFAIAFCNRGSAHLMLKQYDQAFSDFKKALELDPCFLKPINNLALLHISLDQIDQAQAYLDRGWKISTTSHRLYNLQGMVYNRQKKYQKALDFFSNAIKKFPIATLYNNRANTYFYLQRYREALEDYHQALKQYPPSLTSRINRGNVYVVLGEFHHAQNDYQAVLEMMPDKVFPHLALMEVALFLETPSLFETHFNLVTPLMLEYAEDYEYLFYHLLLFIKSLIDQSEDTQQIEREILKRAAETTLCPSQTAGITGWLEQHREKLPPDDLNRLKKILQKIPLQTHPRTIPRDKKRELI